MSALGSSVSSIKIMKSYVLHDFLLLVHITLRNRNVLLGLKIVLSCISI